MSPGAFRPEARIAVFEFIEGFYNPRRRHSSIGYLSPNDYERCAANPGAHQHATVLAAVKDKPSGRPPSGAVLDRRCARRLQFHWNRNQRWAVGKIRMSALGSIVGIRSAAPSTSIDPAFRLPRSPPRDRTAGA